jgi:hypothetical protein
MPHRPEAKAASALQCAIGHCLTREIAPTGISALVLIDALQQASGLVLPDEKVDTSVDIERCFGLS